MNVPIQRRNRKATAGVDVIKNSLSRKEANEIAERLFDGNSPNMTMDEVFAHAAQFKKVAQPAE